MWPRDKKNRPKIIYIDDVEKPLRMPNQKDMDKFNSIMKGRSIGFSRLTPTIISDPGDEQPGQSITK